MEDKKYNSSIDILKYLCAIMIVDMHIRFDGSQEPYIFDLERFALYFFHCTLGFFFAKSLSKNPKQTLHKYIKRLSTPLIFWAIVYLPVNFYNRVIAQSQDIVIFFVNGVAFPLWFLVSSMLNALIVFLFYIQKKLKMLYIVSLILFVVGVLGSYYSCIGNCIPVVKDIISMKYFTSLCRLLLHGVSMFVMGVFVFDKYAYINKIRSRKLFSLCTLSLFLCILETYFANKYLQINSNMCVVSLAIFTFYIVILLLRNNVIVLDKFSKPLKYMSTFMYYSHQLFSIIISSIFFRVAGIKLDKAFLAFLTMFLCSLVGLVFYKINNKKLNSILN